MLELVFGEHAVLLVVLLVDLLFDSWPSELVLGLGFLLEVTTLTILDVLESLSEAILDGKDLSSSLVQEVINF